MRNTSDYVVLMFLLPIIYPIIYFLFRGYAWEPYESILFTLFLSVSVIHYSLLAIVAIHKAYIYMRSRKQEKEETLSYHTIFGEQRRKQRKIEFKNIERVANKGLIYLGYAVILFSTLLFFYHVLAPILSVLLFGRVIVSDDEYVFLFYRTMLTYSFSAIFGAVILYTGYILKVTGNRDNKTFENLEHFLNPSNY